LRRWFEKNHASTDELWIGYYKKGTGKPAVTYLEAVEEALCFGWIDGQVRSLDDLRYANRYTPRRSGSRWSRVNVAKVEELIRRGRMHAAGLRAFSERSRARAGYSFEGRPIVLASGLLAEFRRHRGAWRFFQSQPPSYRKTATFWVMSARRDETRRRRLSIVVDRSDRGLRIDLLSPGRRTVRPAKSRGP
jgi:uncharacterized protein YdeI (YjbR/CyaY-like superfamily)